MCSHARHPPLFLKRQSGARAAHTSWSRCRISSARVVRASSAPVAQTAALITVRPRSRRDRHSVLSHPLLPSNWTTTSRHAQVLVTRVAVWRQNQYRAQINLGGAHRLTGSLTTRDQTRTHVISRSCGMKATPLQNHKPALQQPQRGCQRAPALRSPQAQAPICHLFMNCGSVIAPPLKRERRVKRKYRDESCCSHLAWCPLIMVPTVRFRGQRLTGRVSHSQTLMTLRQLDIWERSTVPGRS